MTGFARTPPALLSLGLVVAAVDARSSRGTRAFLDYTPAPTVLTLEGVTLAPGREPRWNATTQGPLCQQGTSCTPVRYASYPSILGILCSRPPADTAGGPRHLAAMQNAGVKTNAVDKLRGSIDKTVSAIKKATASADSMVRR